MAAGNWFIHWKSKKSAQQSLQTGGRGQAARHHRVDGPLASSPSPTRPARGQETGLLAVRKPAAIAGVTPRLPLSGRMRGAPPRTCTARDDLGPGAGDAGPEDSPPAKCAHLASPCRPLAPQPVPGAPGASGVAPAAGATRPQPHLSPPPPLPSPSQEPPGRLRSPGAGSMESPGLALRRPRRRSRGERAGTRGALPGAAAAATAAPGRATSGGRGTCSRKSPAREVWPPPDRGREKGTARRAEPRRPRLAPPTPAAGGKVRRGSRQSPLRLSGNLPV